MNLNLLHIIFNVYISIYNYGIFYLNRIPYFTYCIDYCKPYFLSLSCNMLYYYGQFEILYNRISPTEKDYEYLSLYCIEKKEFINCNNEISKILRTSDRKDNYLLKFRKLKWIGRFHLSPDKIITCLEDIVTDADKMVLSAIYKETNNNSISEIDITNLLNEYLICNFSNTFKLSEMIDDTSTIFNFNGHISIINNTADMEELDINTFI